jgi:hypothetical protein
VVVEKKQAWPELEVTYDEPQTRDLDALDDTFACSLSAQGCLISVYVKQRFVYDTLDLRNTVSTTPHAHTTYLLQHPLYF